MRKLFISAAAAVALMLATRPGEANAQVVVTPGYSYVTTYYPTYSHRYYPYSSGYVYSPYTYSYDYYYPRSGFSFSYSTAPSWSYYPYHGSRYGYSGGRDWYRGWRRW